MRGLSSPTGMLAAPFVNGYTKALAAYPKGDPARARKLLAEAGYPEGFTLTLDAPNDRYVNDEAIATAVVGFLARIGVKVTVQARPFALHNALLTKGDSDFYLSVWLGGAHPRLGLCLRLPGPHPGQESPGHLEHHGLQQPAARCPDRVAVL